jgi:hypothetical protein
MNESSLPGAIVILPNDIASAVSVGAAAAEYEVPVIIANPFPKATDLNTTIPAVEWNAIKGPYMTTLYAAGTLGAEGALTGIPSQVDVLDLGGRNPYAATEAIDNHFFYPGMAAVVTMNTPVGLTDGAVAGAFAGGNVGGITTEYAPILLAQPGRYPLNISMTDYLATFAPKMWTSIGVGSAVSPQVLATFRAYAGGTAMAQMANRAIRYSIQDFEYASEWMPHLPNYPLTSPAVGSDTLAMDNYMPFVHYFAPGAPKLPVSLQSVGIHNLPPQGAIVGLGSTEQSKLISQASTQPLLDPLTKTLSGQQLLIQAVRSAATFQNVDGVQSTGSGLIDSLIVNDDDSLFAHTWPMDLDESPQAGLVISASNMQMLNVTYRQWFAVTPQTTIRTTSLAAGPPGAIRNTVTISHLTEYTIQGFVSNNKEHWGIVEGIHPNNTLVMDEITADGQTRWYVDSFADQTFTFVKLLWQMPQTFHFHWPAPQSFAAKA